MHHPHHPHPNHVEASVDGYEIRALSSFEKNYAKSTAGGSGIIVYGLLLESEEMDVGHVEKAIDLVMKKHPLLGAQIVEGSTGSLHSAATTTTSNRKKNMMCVRMASKHHTKMSSDVVEEKPWPQIHHQNHGEEEEEEEEEGGGGLAVLHCEDSHGFLHGALVQELNLPFHGSNAGLDPIAMAPVNLFKACFYRATNPARNARTKLKGIVLRLHNALFDPASMRLIARDLLVAIASVMNGNGEEELRSAMARGGTRTGTFLSSSSSSPSSSSSSSSLVKMTGPASTTTSNMTMTPRSRAHDEVTRRARLPLPVEELLPKTKPKSLLKKGMDTASYVMKAKNWRLLPFHTLPTIANNTVRPSFRSDLACRSLGKEGTTSLLASCKREGMKLGVVLATAFLKTAATIKGSKGEKLDEFSFSCVMDCRAVLEPKVDEGVMGNYTLALLTSAKIKDENVDFWNLARQVASSIRNDALKGKHLSKMPLLNMLFSQVLKRPSMTPNSSCRTTLFTISMDTYEPLKESWDIEQTRIVGAIGPLTSVHFVGPCFLVSEALVNDSELLLSFVYPSPLYSRNQILQFLSTSFDILHHATKH